jgi:hypothetical protein
MAGMIAAKLADRFKAIAVRRAETWSRSLTMEQKGKRHLVSLRRVDVAAIETARLEEGPSSARLCYEAKVDRTAYRNLLRHDGRRSGNDVIVGMTRALGLSIKGIVTFTPGRGETA